MTINILFIALWSPDLRLSKQSSLNLILLLLHCACLNGPFFILQYTPICLYELFSRTDNCSTQAIINFKYRGGANWAIVLSICYDCVIILIVLSLLTCRTIINISLFRNVRKLDPANLFLLLL